MSRPTHALRRALTRFGPAAAATAAAAVAATALTAPRPRAQDAPDRDFSAARALRHLREVASEPHPTGSPAADRVRAHLLAELKELGLETEVQDAVAGHAVGRTPYGPEYLAAGRVRNVIGRLPGSVPGRSVLLMTHYDSVPQGPGASDAGVPVAALLEAVRALRADGRTLLNDLLVVFTDGEEAGLLGGRAFFDQHPLAATVGVVLNFEARGTRGPVLMFEAGPGNGPVLEHLAHTGVPVFASSLFDAVYRRMTNATDFSVAKQHGLPGLNFAHIGGFSRYHGPLDDLDHVDHRALQHHGDLALALARRLGDADLAELTGGDAVFFPVKRGTLARLPAAAVPALTATAGLVWAGGLRSALRRGTLDGRRLAGDGALLAAKALAGAAAGTAFTAALGRAAPEFRRHGDFHGSGDVYAAVLGLASAAALAQRGDRSRAASRAAAATLPLTAASAALAGALPGGSYLTLWPWLGAGTGLWLLTADDTGRAADLRHAAGATAAAVPAAALLLPLTRLLFDGLTPRLAGTGVVAVQLAGELAAPALAGLDPRVRRTAVAGGLLLAAGVAARRLARRGKGTPPPETLSHLHLPERGEALWLSSDATPTPRARAALGDTPEHGPLPELFPGWNYSFHHAPAPTVDLPAPRADIEGEAPGEAGCRSVRLLLRSPRGARQLSLAALDTGVRRWRVEDGPWSEPTARTPSPHAPAGPQDGGWELWLHGVPDSGIRVELELPSAPVRLRLLDRVDGLPREPAGLPAGGTGPGEHHPAAALHVDTWGNASLVAATVRIPARTHPQ
ncbi:M20/M25/M40 family metallo-hydrolase [Streptomyces sp. NBC_00487]|uniref:M20/M25/M40 family metallo-hydrolase n=1 Tax=unclassified Streptomyces TaxID=2593676 RepID=UPI002E19294B|nr:MULTISPECIES: M20/M25/M40 family metallo-hydrolase [unclassified Streptomyces]